MQPAQRNSLLLIAVLAGTLGAGRLIDRFGTVSDAAVRLPRLPERVGEWTGRRFDFSDPAFDNYAGSRLGGRRYTNARGETVDLFLVGTARFDQFHTPEYCYIGEGFDLKDEQPETLSTPARTIQAKRMRVENSRDRQEVLFWFQNGEATAPHRAVIKLAALRRMLAGKRPEPLLLLRFSAPQKDGRSVLDTFVPRILSSLEPAAIAADAPAPRRPGAPAPL